MIRNRLTALSLMQQRHGLDHLNCLRKGASSLRTLVGHGIRKCLRKWNDDMHALEHALKRVVACDDIGVARCRAGGDEGRGGVDPSCLFR